MKIKKKQGLPPSVDSMNKHSPNNKKSGAPSPVAHRPLRDRVIHVLALKPYRKAELLLWLEKERANPKDKADLSSVLEEVRDREALLCNILNHTLIHTPSLSPSFSLNHTHTHTLFSSAKR